MIDRQLGFLFGLAATLALVFIAGEYIFSDLWWNRDSWGFSHLVLLTIFRHFLTQIVQGRNDFSIY